MKTASRPPAPSPPVAAIFFKKGRIASARQLCSRRECDHVGLLYRDRRKGHSVCLRKAVLAPQVAVGFHCQRAAVFVPKPAGDSWNVHAAFDAARREQMAQVVMCDAIRADFFARAIKRLLAFADTEDSRVQGLAMTFAPHSLK